MSSAPKCVESAKPADKAQEDAAAEPKEDGGTTLLATESDLEHLNWLIFKHRMNRHFRETMPNRPLGKVTKLTGKKNEEVEAGLAQFRKEIDFYEAHFHELRKKYPEQWVGILNEKVAAIADSRDALRDKCKAKGIPMNAMYVRRLSKEFRIRVGPAI